MRSSIVRNSTASSSTSDLAAQSRAAVAAAPVDPGVAVALLFFLSGGASLLLETAAVRAFLELFGSTAASLGAVGGAFLVCLAFGAFVLGAQVDRAARPLRWYAALEAIACIGGLLALAATSKLDPLATALAKAEARGDFELAARLLSCVALLIIPVGALGATLPLLARLRAAGRTQEGARAAAAGGLQVASALGATVGAFCGPALLLGSLGTRGTWAVAAAINGLVALAAAWLARGERPLPDATVSESRRAPTAASAESDRARGETTTTPATALVVASFLTGFTVLALEILLFRGLGQVTRGSQDTLGALLAAFLAASAIGSGIGVKLARGRERALVGFSIGQALSIAAPLVALVWLRAMAGAGELDWLRFGASATSWPQRLARECLGAFLVAGPAACATAIAFPCACELARGGRFGRTVAWLSGAWTVGAAAAGLVVPALLLPALGLRGALLLAAALPLVGFGVVALADRSLFTKARVVWPAAAIGGAVLLLAVPVGGASALGEPLRFFQRVAGGAGGRALDYREEAAANVAVVERTDGERVLAVNDQLALGGSGSPRVEQMQGVLPALLHPAPKRALALGVGTGATIAALCSMGCEEVDAVDLLPSVLSMLPWFADQNGGLAQDRRVKLLVGDARSFARVAEPQSYDLVVGDLYFPWEAEAGLLYTKEHFERVKRLLKPDGLFCQWLPCHQLRWEELGMVGRTFAEVFDGATVWLARADFPFPVLGLVAGPERLELDVVKLTARLEKHRAMPLLARLGVADAKDFLALYVADEWFFREQFDDKSINTADLARVEFLSARRVETDPVVALHNRRRLFELHEDVVYRMTQSSISKLDLARLKRELSAASQTMWKLFDAQTDLLLATANRALPLVARRNVPEELETRAFQVIGGLMRDRPDHAPAGELMLALLGEQLRLRSYGRVVEGVTTLENEPAVGSRARLRYLRGLAFLRAVCDADPKQAAQFTKPLDFAVKDFRKAADLDPTLIEARLHLALALFLTGTKESWDEARALLQAAREKIVAPDRPEGHGLPAPQEAILSFLLDKKEEAQQWLARPEAQPWAAKIAERMRAGAPAKQ